MGAPQERRSRQMIQKGGWEEKDASKTSQIYLDSSTLRNLTKYALEFEYALTTGVPSSAIVLQSSDYRNYTITTEKIDRRYIWTIVVTEWSWKEFQASISSLYIESRLIRGIRY